jgi:3-hydroxyisobutyrate dehydrogenase-like beta-hydroxyacid dehydrogenase
MTTNKKVAVIGTGMMGSTLARLLLKNGYTVTAWNRSSAKLEPLVKKGVVAAESAASAVAAGDVIVMCVYDYKAIDSILQNKEVEAAFAGKLLIQFTTGSPQDARNYASWTKKLGATYLDGAIQVAPAQMGRADTPILISGEETVYREHETLLRVFGGGLTWLGNDASAANVLDLATLSALYGAIVGFFQGALVAEAEGFDVSRYGEIVNGIMPTFGEFLQHEGRVIASGNFSVSQSPLKISVEATERILQHAREKKIHTGYPVLMAKLLKDANDAGYADEELAAVIKVLRREN